METDEASSALVGSCHRPSCGRDSTTAAKHDQVNPPLCALVVSRIDRANVVFQESLHCFCAIRFGCKGQRLLYMNTTS